MSQYSAYGPNSYAPFYIPPPGIKEDYSKVVAVVENKEKAHKISVILSYLFSNTLRDIQLSFPSKDFDSIVVKVEHPLTQGRPLPSHSTFFYTPDVVIFTVYKSGQIRLIQERAPYEQVHLLSLNVWHFIDIIDDTVHIGSTNVHSRYIPIVNEGGTSTAIPYQSILNALLLRETK